MNPVLKCGIRAGNQEVGMGADRAQKIVDPVAVGFGKIAQHMAGHTVFGARMPNAQSRAAEISSHMRLD